MNSTQTRCVADGDKHETGSYFPSGHVWPSYFFPADDLYQTKTRQKKTKMYFNRKLYMSQNSFSTPSGYLVAIPGSCYGNLIVWWAHCSIFFSNNLLEQHSRWLLQMSFMGIDNSRGLIAWKKQQGENNCIVGKQERPHHRKHGNGLRLSSPRNITLPSLDFLWLFFRIGTWPAGRLAPADKMKRWAGVMAWFCRGFVELQISDQTLVNVDLSDPLSSEFKHMELLAGNTGVLNGFGSCVRRYTKKVRPRTHLHWTRMCTHKLELHSECEMVRAHAVCRKGVSWTSGKPRWPLGRTRWWRMYRDEPQQSEQTEFYTMCWRKIQSGQNGHQLSSEQQNLICVLPLDSRSYSHPNVFDVIYRYGGV